MTPGVPPTCTPPAVPAPAAGGDGAGMACGAGDATPLLAVKDTSSTDREERRRRGLAAVGPLADKLSAVPDAVARVALDEWEGGAPGDSITPLASGGVPVGPFTRRPSRMAWLNRTPAALAEPPPCNRQSRQSRVRAVCSGLV